MYLSKVNDGKLPNEPTNPAHVYRYAVDRQGSASDAFFDWPEDVPQPITPAQELHSKVDANATEDSEPLPETAKGKYQTFGSQGPPRGFDDKAAMERHSEMLSRMRRIVSALDEHAYAHDWTYPEDLQTLVGSVEYLKPTDLENPVHPDADPPYGYIRPDFDLPDRLERMVLYEPFDQWPGVVTVMFQDGSVEFIHDEAKFERMVEEATSP